MTLAFYKVDNSLGLERHSFDCEDKSEKIMETLAKLPDGECKIYNMDYYGWGNRPAPNAADFEEDYNNEELDGGWWCIVIQ